MCEISPHSTLLVISIFAADVVLCQRPRIEMDMMPLEGDVEAAVALAEAFKEHIGAGSLIGAAEADPARAMGEEG